MLRYDGVGIGSNKSFSVTSVSNKESFSKDSQILNRENAYVNFGNPCDLYSVSLDGSVSALPENPVNQNVGIWSALQTNEKGQFSTPITIVMKSDEYFSTAGITVKFDTNKGIYANRLRVKWYQDNSVLSEKEFTPDNAEYFCDNKVELYNRVDIILYSMNVPYNRLRLQGVEFGIVTEFTSRVLKNSAIKQSASPISEKLPINTLDFSIVSRDGIDFVFQQRQPIDAFFDDKLKGKFFIKTATKSGHNAYSVTCEDYIGLLENATFNGGIYENESVGYLIRSICGVAGVPVVVPAEYENRNTVTGYLPRSTCRKALQQVLFSECLAAATSNATSLIIRSIDNEVKQTIPRERIMQGISVKESDRISAVSMNAHAYILSEEETILYDAQKSGTGENIEVLFYEPYHSLTLNYGKLIEWGANYAIINAIDEKSVLKGKRYIHTISTKTRQNALLTASDTKKSLEIKDATLVNADNIDRVLDKCYNYLVNNKSVSARIVEGKHDAENGYTYDMPINLLENLTLNTAFSDAVTARLESQAYSMNGGILVKECSLR